jgi:hypothetical protein
VVNDEQDFVVRDATTWKYIRRISTFRAKALPSLKMKGFRSKHRNSPYIFSGSCIPTIESLFILLALSRLTKTVEDYWWWLSNNKIIVCSDCMQKQLQCERDSCISLTLQLLSSLPTLALTVSDCMCRLVIFIATKDWAQIVCYP